MNEATITVDTEDNKALRMIRGIMRSSKNRGGKDDLIWKRLRKRMLILHKKVEDALLDLDTPMGVQR